MYEFSVAKQYLKPRWRQLSVSIISLISIFVIALVVWLIVVFFSVTNGLTNGWIDKLIALTATVRVTPSPDYYKSYYYNIDSLSEKSGFALKTLGEKLDSDTTDPYDPEFDQEAPLSWEKNLVNADGSIKDIVKETALIFNDLGLPYTDYELTSARLKLDLVRQTPGIELKRRSTLDQDAYIGSYDQKNQQLSRSILSPTAADLSNFSAQLAEEINPKKLNLFEETTLGHPLYLPKSFREAGILIGDHGYISYFSPTASALQEERFKVFVAGFYDPGVMPTGSKFIIAPGSIVSAIRAIHAQEESSAHPTNGFNLHLTDRDKAPLMKAKLIERLKNAGLDRYWKIETFRDYEMTKDFIQQLASEKRLFTLLAGIIILVACSNIISMLIILVNDKKHEIGILRSMGASSISIALIFGICGVVMGMAGSILGTLLAIVTLKNLQSIVDFISYLQGYEMFNPHFYGDSLPTDLSFEAFAFVVVATGIVSLIAGIVPAIKACLLKPAQILRAE